MVNGQWLMVNGRLDCFVPRNDEGRYPSLRGTKQRSLVLKIIRCVAFRREAIQSLINQYLIKIHPRNGEDTSLAYCLMFIRPHSQ